jgi:hypothetical protein
MGVTVLDAIFINNISAISWLSVLLVDKTTDLSQVTGKLHHIMLYRVLFWLGRLIFSASINSHILIIYEREEIVFLSKGPSWS